MAVGSVPAAIAGVIVIEQLEKSYGEDRLKGIVFGLLGGTLVVVGVATMLRTLFIPDVIKERFAMHLHRRHIIAAIATGLITGFVIGLTSAGSGTLIGIILIAVFRLTPNRVVGTDIFHAAVLLWAASAAHLVGGNIDFGLAGNILIGSIPGVLIGGKLAFKSGKNLLRGLLAAVLIASGTILITKGDFQLAMIAGSIVGGRLRPPLHLHPAARGEAAPRRGSPCLQADQHAVGAEEPRPIPPEPGLSAARVW